MKTRIIAAAIVTFLVVTAILGYFYYDELNRDFTPWMSLAELNGFIKKFDPTPPVEPTYWEKGHWITAAEGRWQDGIPQYRIRYGATPPNHRYVWFWFINEDQQSFGAKLQKYADDGFVLVYQHEFKRPDGSTRYQAVWHKLSDSD